MIVAPGADGISWVKFVLACAVVTGLLALMAFLLKHFRLRNLTTPAARGRRLGVIESLALDMRRRLVIVRCDEAEHLLLLGPEEDIVVEANLDKTPRTSFKSKTVA